MSQIHQYGPSYIQLNPPNEWPENDIDFTVNDSVSESKMNTNIFTFSREAAEFLTSWKTTNGVFNGVPYRVIYKSELDGSQLVVFDGYIDISDPECFINSQINPIIITAPVVRINDSKSVIENMAVITQGLLISKGILTTADFVDIPVIIESKKNIAERAAELGAFGVQVVTSLTQIVNNILGALANVLGLGIVIGIIELAIVFANAVLVINRLVDQGLKLKDLFFPTVQYYKGFNVAHMIRKGFEYKGYTVEFGDLEGVLNKTYILPSQNNTTGFPMAGFPAMGPCKPQDYGYTIMEIINGVKEQRNIRGDVRNGIVHLKRRNDPFWTASPSYSPPNVLIKDTQLYTNGLYKDDTERVKATFTGYYTYDSTDCHTLTEKNGDSVEVHRDLINELNPKMNTIKGLEEHVIPWAMCVRKQPFDNLWDLFTGISDDFDNLLQIIKDRINEFLSDLSASGVDVTSEINDLLNQSGLNTLLNNRTGCWKIDDNTFAIPKIGYMVDEGHGNRIPANFKDEIGWPALYNSGYLSDSPAIQNDFKGQYRLVKELNLPFSIENFVITQTNPFFVMNANICKFLFGSWNEAKHKSTADIEINEPFDTNITETVI